MEFLDTSLTTPQKIPEMQDLFMIENLEKELECFSHLLEKSSEKEKNATKRINCQSNQIINLQKENKLLREENESLRQVVENALNKIQVHMESSIRNVKIEEENLSLRQKLDQTLTECHERIVDLELEKEKLSIENIESKKSVSTLNAMNTKLTEKLESINKYIIECFQKTLSYSNTIRIQELEDSMKSKDDELKDSKKNADKIKEDYEKMLKNMKLEYDLLSMDYTNTLATNIQRAKSMNERKEITEAQGRRTKKITSIKMAVANRIDEEQMDEEYDDGDVEFRDPNNDEDEESEYERTKNDHRKRKATNVKKRPETKKVKKNENKEFLLSNRNHILYQLKH